MSLHDIEAFKAIEPYCLTPVEWQKGFEELLFAFILKTV